VREEVAENRFFRNLLMAVGRPEKSGNASTMWAFPKIPTATPWSYEQEVGITVEGAGFLSKCDAKLPAEPVAAWRKLCLRFVRRRYRPARRNGACAIIPEKP